MNSKQRFAIIIASAFLAVAMIFLFATVALPLYAPKLVKGMNTPIATLDNAMSFSDVMNVIGADPINERAYNEVSYNCVDFSWDTMRMLNSQGINARILIISYINDSKHAVVIVPTCDKGWVIIETMNDSIISPNIGQRMLINPFGNSKITIPMPFSIVAKMEVLDFDFVDIKEYIGNGSIYEK